MSSVKSILLIDDHALIRSGIKALVEKPGWTVFEASSATEGLSKVAEINPAIVILDMSLPDGNGDEVLKKIKQKRPETLVIMLSMHMDVDFINACFEKGANGYVVKSDSAGDIVNAIEEALKGRRYVSHKAQQVMIERMIDVSQKKTKTDTRLTEREEEILHLIKSGLHNNEIAEKLVLSRRTIETHRASLMKKLGVKNVVELINKSAHL